MGKAPRRLSSQACGAAREELALGDVVDGAAGEGADDEGIEEAAVVGGQNEGAAARKVLGADALEAEVDEEEGQQKSPDEQIEQRIDAALLRALAKTLQIAAHALDTQRGWRRYSMRLR